MTPYLVHNASLCVVQELESDRQYRQAEHHFVQGNEWKLAVNMYRTHGLWDDAYRVSERKGRGRDCINVKGVSNELLLYS